MNETVFVIVSASAIICAVCAVVATRQRAEPPKPVEPPKPEPVLDIDEQIARAMYHAEYAESNEAWGQHRLRYPALYRSELAQAKAARLFLAKRMMEQSQ